MSLAATKNWLIVITAIGLAFAVASILYQNYLAIRDSYCVDWTASMVIIFVMENDGKLPMSWEDLEAPYEVVVSASGRPWSFETIRSRVVIDWHVKATEEIMSTDNKFEYISLTNKRSTKATWNANERIRNCLIQIESEK